MRRLSTSVVPFVVVSIGLVALLLTMTNQTESQTSEELTDKMAVGIDHADCRKFEEAESLFREILSGSEDGLVIAAAHNNLANTNLLQGKYASAIENYHMALRYDQTDPSIHLNLGIVYHLQMEITDDKAYIDNKKLTATKDDWKECSERAFQEALKQLDDAEHARQKLMVPSRDAEFGWIRESLDKAAIQVSKAKLRDRVVGTAGKGKKVRVYWKKV
ncbi:tetratricopeptide repeat protein [Candidatus Poribacteria bacterium]